PCCDAEWTQSDLVRGSRLRYSQQWTLLKDMESFIISFLFFRLLSGTSPVRGLRAVVRETGGHQLLEIWDGHGLKKCFNLTALNKHGRVYEDAQFGCLSWSKCENKLLYVAEKRKNVTADAHNKESDRNVYCEDWGEALTNKSVPVICAVNLQCGSLSVLPGVPPDVSPGQALWAPGGQSVIFVGWHHKPFRLGLKFCSNRRSALFKLDLDGNCECLSGDNLSVSCPRLSPDGSTLVYLQGQVFGPHNQCLTLQQLDLESRKTSTLVDVVNRPQMGEFAGVYENLPPCCWSADSQRVVFSSARRNWKVANLFMLTLSDPSTLYGSWKLLTIQKDLMVVCCSGPSTPPTLVRPRAHAHTQSTIVKYYLCHSGLDFGAVLVKPLRSLHKAKIPLVVFIHGLCSLRSSFITRFKLSSFTLCLCVCLVNYRGSTGFGQDSILSLLGQIGSQDVKDVQRAVLAALQADDSLDSRRLAVIGGSHGGFLACHLIGQYPDFYRACAVRNPVINAATLLGTSDIVDWRYTSVGFQYSYGQIPTADALAAMLEKSPIRHAAQIKAPVLLMLGGKDRRVSPHQGLELYKVLKSRASPVRLLWFPEDGHALSRVDTQADCFLNTALWLQQHL
uniref:Acylamino-acid-releasing enzyme n=1 Tax=Mola mola TaxID=94237 RepID=A0A3Q4BM22_MOLML